MRTLKESQFIKPEEADQKDKIRIQPGKTQHSSGKVVDIVITPDIQAVIDRAQAIKRERGVISPYLFPTRNRTPYTRFGVRSMWDRAKERAKIERPITFRDIRALAATDAAKRGESKDAIRARLAHTTTKTSEIYIKEAVPEVSDMALKLPWKTV
jgi:integrase